MNGRRFCVVSLALMAVVVAGCESNNKGKIEGTKWSSMSATVDGQRIPAGALKLEFSKDGKLRYDAGPKVFTGTYSLGSGDYVTLNLNQDLAGRKQHVETIKIEGSKLTMIDSDGTSLSFRKVTSSSKAKKSGDGEKKSDQKK